jgi:hypothetical protein
MDPSESDRGRTSSAAADEAAIAVEFDCLMARAGIAVPAAQRSQLIGHYTDLRKQFALLHSVHPPALEPSNVFTVARSGGEPSDGILPGE